MNIENIAMQLIICAGDARAYSYEALTSTKNEDYHKAEALMEKAEEEIGKAHDIQTEVLQKEAAGEKVDIGILFVHAQDHLMTAISEINLIKEIIEVTKVMNKLKNI